MNINLGAWFYGMVMALIVAALTGLAAWATLPDTVTTKQIVVVCVIPAFGGFIAWLKQTPPPTIGGGSVNPANPKNP